MRQFFSDFRLFSEWATEFLMIPPFVFVTAGLFVALCLALWFSRSRLRSSWKPSYAVVLLQFVGFPILIAVAVLGRVEAIPWPRQQPHTWAIWASEITFWGTMLFGTICIWRMKPLRGIAICIFLVCQWLMQGAGMIAGSALSGVWP